MQIVFPNCLFVVIVFTPRFSGGNERFEGWGGIEKLRCQKYDIGVGGNLKVFEIIVLN